MTLDSRLTNIKLTKLNKFAQSLDEDAVSDDLLERIEQWFDDHDYVLMTSSGSTGIPRLIKVSKDDIKASCKRTSEFFSLKRGGTFLLCLPLTSIGGSMVIFRALEIGGEVLTVRPSLRPLSKLETQCKMASMTPLQLHETIIHDKDKLDLVDIFLIGGAPISKVLNDQCRKLNLPIYESYGMTETVSHVALRDVHTEDAFQALEEVTFEEDEEGCLIVHDQLLSHDSVVTNDIVKLLNDKSFIWQGRRDFIINSGGLKVNPIKIESALAPIIERPFFIYGLKDDVLGSKIILIIEDIKWTKDKLDELTEKIQANFEKKLIPKEIYFINRFSNTHSGKLDRTSTAKSVINKLTN